MSGPDCEPGEKFSDLANAATEHAFSIHISKRRGIKPGTLQLALPTDGKFAYPVGKARTKENVETMRRAVDALDRFWNQLEADLRAVNITAPANIRSVLKGAGRHPSPPWVQRLDWETAVNAKPGVKGWEPTGTNKHVIKRIFYVPSKTDPPPNGDIS